MMIVLHDAIGSFPARIATETGMVRCHVTGLDNTPYSPGDWIATASELNGEPVEFVIQKDEQSQWRILVEDD